MQALNFVNISRAGNDKYYTALFFIPRITRIHSFCKILIQGLITTDERRLNFFFCKNYLKIFLCSISCRLRKKALPLIINIEVNKTRL